MRPFVKDVGVFHLAGKETDIRLHADELLGRVIADAVNGDAGIVVYGSSPLRVVPAWKGMAKEYG